MLIETLIIYALQFTQRLFSFISSLISHSICIVVYFERVLVDYQINQGDLEKINEDQEESMVFGRTRKNVENKVMRKP